MRRIRSRCCARAASGHADRRAAEQRDELAPLHVRPQAQETASYRLKRVL